MTPLFNSRLCFGCKGSSSSASTYCNKKGKLTEATGYKSLHAILPRKRKRHGYATGKAGESDYIENFHRLMHVTCVQGVHFWSVRFRGNQEQLTFLLGNRLASCRRTSDNKSSSSRSCSLWSGWCLVLFDWFQLRRELDQSLQASRSLHVKLPPSLKWNWDVRQFWFSSLIRTLRATEKAALHIYKCETHLMNPCTLAEAVPA